MIQQGDPIWVESCLTDEEYKISYGQYSTFKSGTKIPLYECDFKWRWRMGEFLSAEEVRLINSRIDYLLKTVR